MVQYYLTEQDSRALQRVMQPGETTSPDRDLAIPSTLPLLAKADADIASLALGTFTLQMNKPDALADGATTRDAYALGDIKLGELVTLNRLVGEASQGFWAATSVGTPKTTEDCLCLIKDIILVNFTLTDAEQTELTDLCGMCNASTSTCSNCRSGSTPDPMPVSLTVVADQPNDLGYDWVTILGDIASIDMVGCSGSLTIPLGPSPEAHGSILEAPIGTDWELRITLTVSPDNLGADSHIRILIDTWYFELGGVNQWFNSGDGANYTTAIVATKVECDTANDVSAVLGSGGAESQFWTRSVTNVGG